MLQQGLDALEGIGVECVVEGELGALDDEIKIRDIRTGHRLRG